MKRGNSLEELISTGVIHLIRYRERLSQCWQSSSIFSVMECNLKIMIWCCALVVSIPLMLLFWHIAAPSGSIKVVNNEGQSGHPCLAPRSLKLYEVIPFVVIVAIGRVYSVLIQWMNNSPKLNLQTLLSRDAHLTLSNAFLASNYTIIILTGFCCETLILSTDIVRGMSFFKWNPSGPCGLKLA